MPAGPAWPDEEALLCAILFGEGWKAIQSLLDAEDALRRLAGPADLIAAPWRLGHTVEEAPASADIRVLPILAALLFQQRVDLVAARVSALWWDRALQKAVRDKRSAVELAGIVREAPARRLAVDPETWLREMEQGSPDAYERLVQAIYPLPSRPDLTTQERRAQLYTHPLCSERWQRLAEMIPRLDRNPYELIAGAEVHLRQEVTVYVAEALENLAPAPEQSPFYFWEHLEALCLRHAAAIVLANGEGDAKLAWDIGHWMVRVLRESPFLGADPEILSARLDWQPPHRQNTSLHRDPWWPGDIGFEKEQIRLQDILLCKALWENRDRWQLPGPVVAALLRFGSRKMSAAEYEAVAALEKVYGDNAFPMAPPLCARRLVHEAKAPWLGHLSEDAQQEMLDGLSRKPDLYTWVMVALYREDGSLLEGIKSKSKEVFLGLLSSIGEGDRSRQDIFGPYCLWGSASLDRLNEDQSGKLLNLAVQCDPRWRVGVLLTFANAWNVNPALANEAWAQLLRLVRGVREPSLRLPAARAAVQAAARRSDEAERGRLLDRVMDSLSPELKSHPDVRLEFKRAGRSVG